MSLYTLNGSLLLEQAACASTDDTILTCAFYEGVNNEWLDRQLLFTGHRRGVVNVSSTSLAIPTQADTPDLEQDYPPRAIRAGLDPAAPPRRQQPGQRGEHQRGDQQHPGAVDGGVHGG